MLERLRQQHTLSRNQISRVRSSNFIKFTQSQWVNLSVVYVENASVTSVATNIDAFMVLGCI